LETTFQLVQGGSFNLALRGGLISENGFERASAQKIGHTLTTPSGFPGDPILQIRRNGQVERELRRSETSGFRHLSFTFDRQGEYFLSGGDGGELTLYDTRLGEEIRSFAGHTGDVWALAVSPENRLAVSGSADQTLRFWSFPAGELLVSIFVGDNREWVAWTPKGYYTASARGDRYIGWQINHGVDQAADYYPVEHFQKLYYRPDIVNLTLELRNPDLAIEEANHRRHLSPPTEIMQAMPPQIVVVSPREGVQLTRNRKLKVTSVATSTVSPIEELKITLNGQVVNLLAGSIKGSPLQRTEEIEVELSPGRNLLTFTAATANSRSLTTERVVIYDAPSTDVSISDKRALAVLAVGIADYRDLGLRLQFAAADARAISELFQSQEGKAFSQVSTLVLDGSTLVNRDALIRALRWLKDVTPGKNSIRLVFLSGHGALDSSGNYYFLAQDQDPGADFEEKSLNWRVLVERLTEGNDTTAILMLDTCHAAAARGRLPAGSLNITEQLRLNSRSNLITFSSSSESQSSIEGEGHGLFTAAILEGLRDLQADGYGGREKDGRIEAVELGTFVSEMVSKKTRGSQRPNFAPPPGLDILQLFRSLP
jgi:hypothetical protein